MAHGLNVENGKASMMYVGRPPWHGLGQNLEKPPTAAEAINAAGLDWEVRDPVDKFLLLSNSHDGQSAVQIKFTHTGGLR